MTNYRLPIHFIMPYVQKESMYSALHTSSSIRTPQINKSNYAVMICDLRMPVINGSQLLQTVKDLNPLSRTILITA